MAQGKRERHPHQLILKQLADNTEKKGENLTIILFKTAVSNLLLEFLEQMKISRAHAREIANELEIIVSQPAIDNNQHARISALIAEFSR